MPTTPENGRPAATTQEASKTPAQVTAEDLRNSLVAMAENQQAGVKPEANPAPESVLAPEPLAPLPGRFEASGAAAGSKVDALVERGSSAVAAGKEKIGEKIDGAALKTYELAGKVDNGIKGAKERAADIRERVKNGAEVAAEKKRESVRSAKEKSKQAMLLAIGVSITAGETLAEAPEKIKNRGRKIADKLNKWCAKAKELFSGMKDNVKDRVTEGIGKVVVEAVVRIDTAGQNWEARLQEARKEAEVAAEKARKESLVKSYIEARILAAQEQADAEHAAAVKQADEEREAKVNQADSKRHDAVEKARQDAAGEVATLSADQIEVKIENLGQTAPEAGVTVEKPTGIVPGASEPVPLRQPTPDSAPPAPEVAAA